MKSVAAIASLALATLQGVTALGDLGYNIGVQRNSDAACKTTDDYLNDFHILSGYTNLVRVYASSDCNTLENIAPALEQSGFKAVLGVWPTDETHYEAEQAALKAHLPKMKVGNVKGVSVGSEALYRGDLTPSELAEKVKEIKDLLKNIEDEDGNSYGDVPVGFFDSWNEIVGGGTEVAIQASDFVYANAFSFWQGQTMANSSYSFFDDIMQALQVIQTAKGSTDIDFYVGETGWPTNGNSFGSSVPSTENAEEFWQEGICAIRAWGVNVLVFEAFDESWKPDTEADNGQSVGGVERYWGVFNEETGKPKYDITCKFD